MVCNFTWIIWNFDKNLFVWHFQEENIFTLTLKLYFLKVSHSISIIQKENVFMEKNDRLTPSWLQNRLQMAIIDYV